MSEQSFYPSIEKLVEFGIGISIAQQMVATMNQVMQQSAVAGSAQALRQTDQQAFYVIIESAVVGPWSRQQVQSAMLTGQLGRTSYIWSPGMPQWSRASDLTYFATMPAVPPPFPSETLGTSEPR